MKVYKDVVDFMISSKEFFTGIVDEAVNKRKMKISLQAKLYLVDLLSFYMFSENLFGDEGKKETTLAEMFLTAINSEYHLQIDLLKKLGDSSLYISGFFGDSLKNKIIDLDYYIDMGGSAYSSLASVEKLSERAIIFEEFSFKFMEFVDVLTYISQKSFVQTNQDLLRLYDRYISTGSDLAREELIEKGLLHSQLKKKAKH